MSLPPAVLLDSAADIDFMQAEEVGVNLLMQTVEFAGQVWLDAHDLSSQELFSRLRAGAPRPHNTPMSVDAYAGMLERMLGRSSHVLALHPDAQEQEAMSVATQAARQFPGRVTVVDARTSSVGMALQARWAAQQFRQGAGVPEVVRELHARQQAMQVVMSLDTVEFLKLAGRPSPWLARVPPGARVVLGAPGAQSRLLGVSQQPETAFRILKQRLRQYARERPGADVAFFHRDARTRAHELSLEASTLGLRVHWLVQGGLVVSALTGPGTYGFAALPA